MTSDGDKETGAIVGQDWTDGFAGLSRLSTDVKATLLAESRVATVPQGTMIFGPGKAPENLLLLLDGTVRVQQTSETGREVVALPGHRRRELRADHRLPARLRGLFGRGRRRDRPARRAGAARARSTTLIARSPEFRRFVFTAYSRRITDLFQVIEEIVFRRVDLRLAQKLLQLAGAEGALQATHHTLALELGIGARGDLAPAAGVPAPRLAGARARDDPDHRPGGAAALRRGRWVT